MIRIVLLAAALTIAPLMPVSPAITSDRDQGVAPKVESPVLTSPFTARNSPKRVPSLVPSTRSAEEGDRLTLTAKIKAPKLAKRVTLQRWTVPLYFGKASWQTVKVKKVSRRSRVKFTQVAAGPNTDKYRVRVTYRKHRTTTSKAVKVKVWRWIPLREFSAYYNTVGAEFSELSLNGRRYPTWGAAYGSGPSWEAKFTAGRNCKAFRGRAALADQSHDGSSGAITLSADDRTIYSSPPLTPGMQVDMKIPLATPYRIWLQAVNTSSDGQKSLPNIGDPALLCRHA